MQTVTAAEFEKAFQEALPQASRVMKTKVDDRSAKGLEIAPFIPSENQMLSAVSLDGTVNGFCKNWPKIESFLNFAIGSVGIFMPAQAALAKAFIAAAKTTIIPLVCPTNTSGQ